jgi:hypothetical protein
MSTFTSIHTHLLSCYNHAITKETERERIEDESPERGDRLVVSEIVKSGRSLERKYVRQVA